MSGRVGGAPVGIVGVAGASPVEEVADLMVQRDTLPKLSAAKLEIAVTAANSFARLSEAQRRVYLDSDQWMAWAFANPKNKIPEREKSLKGNKKTLEEEMNNPKNKNFQIFYQYYVELKNNAQDTMIDEAIKAISSDMEDVPIVYNDIPKMEENLTKMGAALAGSDVQSMLIFLKLYKQFYQWSSVISKDGFDRGLTEAQIRQTLGDACLKLTRFKIEYLYKMHDVVTLIHLYPRLKWAGTTRDILYHHQERFRIHVKNDANEAEFWRQDINRPFLIGLKIRHKIPQGINEDDVIRRMGEELGLGDISTPEARDHIRKWVLDQTGQKRKEPTDQDRAEGEEEEDEEGDDDIQKIDSLLEKTQASSSSSVPQASPPFSQTTKKSGLMMKKKK